MVAMIMVGGYLVTNRDRNGKAFVTRAPGALLDQEVLGRPGQLQLEALALDQTLATLATS
jgi:hypothetical protein